MSTVREITPEVKAALAEMYRRAVERYPTEMARITRGYRIALTGGVDLRGDGLADVRSDSHPDQYWVVNGVCGCDDVAKGQAPAGRCKHRWAKALYTRALTYVVQQAEALPVEVETLTAPYDFPGWQRYQATYQGPMTGWQRCNGVAEVLEAGLFFFLPDDVPGGWHATYDEVALGPGIED